MNMLHALYRSVGHLVHEETLPIPVDSQVALDEGWSRESLADARGWARYFAIGNGLRCLFYALLIEPAFAHRRTVPFALLVLIVAFHALFCVLEYYKKWIYGIYLHEVGDALPPHSPSDSEPVSDLAPKRIRTLRWESARLYRAVGMESIRKWVVSYTEWARGIDAAGPNGVKPKYAGTRTYDLLSYARETLNSELIHGACAASNVLLIGLLYYNRLSTLAAVCASMLTLDVEMILLQRYHRTRILEIVNLREDRQRRSR